ncbi:hypothetical protein COV28_00920 [candidate division WWE3 bacterium CG10_big_fil_rev_8_21_14_0_10_48_23]|uniref:AI-2E family transporter n=1 Tax=candidate division WWE3 bacterium CG_4_9_14_0_2_um_filter_48_10 TaxID=1975078 RepID=A0A2M8EJU8_UNCKA|nr:MAG: hypothetical protein COY35_00350 [candidate division WWE3 bacterium CG_4_10_14_0_2_um_filter_47_8]PJC22957.1 MAG: hypothetical protein CO059_01075 [candidate division WWE3 bacterium CG_4_9_14_0_2_um_filter_48_10]PJE52175.1 MAG: hypothetical protein COV28_00920 [candidate division WWE3 bacterium CG10_big_fil_rev_8_21_14_0_10_48_23]
MNIEQRYEISLKTILTTLGILALFWILIQIKALFITLFVALILCLALDPLVVRLKGWRIPRPLGVILTFLAIVALFGGVIAYGFTPMINQTGKFLLGLPTLLDPFLARLPTPLTDQLKSQLFSQLTMFSSDLLNSTVALASNSLFIITILVFGFYLLLDWENVKTWFIGFFNRPAQKRVVAIIEQMEHRLGGWVRGELALMTIVGVLIFFGLTVLKVEYALPLALIAAVLEIVPMIGPILSMIPAAIVGFSASLWLGIAVLVLYAVVQQVENNFIVPNVMGKAVGFSPLATLIILFIGTELYGVGGLILAIPTTLFLTIVIKDIRTGEEE